MKRERIKGDARRDGEVREWERERGDFSLVDNWKAGRLRPQFRQCRIKLFPAAIYPYHPRGTRPVSLT